MTGAAGAVLIVCPRLGADAAIERRARFEIAALRRAGRPVGAITDLGDPADMVRDRPELEGVEVRVVAPPGLLGRHTVTKELTFGARVWWATRRRTPTGAPDERTAPAVVVCHSAMGLLGARRWIRPHRLPTVFVCHSQVSAAGPLAASGDRLPTRLVGGIALRMALRWADLVVTLSADAATDLRDRRGARPVKVLANPIDTTAFHPEPGVARDIDVLFVGRVTELKGVHVLLDAARALPAGTTIVIAGSGRQLAGLEARAASLPCSVVFMGYLPNEDLPALVRRARVQVVPSLREAQGVVALEALASGTPVIASRVGGLPSVVHDGENGWLVEPGAVDALAARLQQVLADRDGTEAIGARGPASVASFSLAAFGPLVLATYLDGLGPRGGSGTSG